MANLSVLVSLDTTKTPPVTAKPATLEVERGGSVITWSVDPQSPTQGFTFNPLNFGPTTPPCFTNMGVGNLQITIDDNNTATASHAYILAVTYNGRIYTSGPLESSGSAASSAAPRVGSMGSPSIHNK